MLNRVRIGTRLSLGFGVILVAAAASFCAAVLLGLNGQRDTERTSREVAERVGAVQSMQMAQLEATFPTTTRSAQFEAWFLRSPATMPRDHAGSGRSQVDA